MNKKTILFCVFSCCLLPACNSSDEVSDTNGRNGGVDSNLECAALIGAANALMMSGKADKDPALARRALGSSMTYLNAYAIPKGIKEAEAFREVKSLRDGLVEKLPPDTIMNRAKRCVDSAPFQTQTRP